MAPDQTQQTVADDGAYTAERAAALSGVPRTTIHYWARHDILIPAVSQEKVKLWSYADLLRLRIIYWLRQPKTLEEGRDIPSSTMSKVRSALEQLTSRGLDVLSADGTARILVSNDGHVYIRAQGGLVLDGHLHGQTVMPYLDLIAPFRIPGIHGAEGPDLVRPRSTLRIAPRKLAGSPHVADTRIETAAIAALHARGFTDERIAHLYPVLSPESIAQAIDLENQLGVDQAA